MSRIVNARLGHGSMYGDNNSKPVSPDICLEYMWTENQNSIGYIFLHYFKPFVNILFLILFIIYIKFMNLNFHSKIIFSFMLILKIYISLCNLDIGV